jgi:metal-sulfur cluster biosynthetic enzyme
MLNKDEVLKKIKKVMHLAINLNLLDLGIVSDVELRDNKIIVTMVLPALGIPIKDVLLSSVREALSDFKEEIDFELREMSEEEKANFFNLEHANWKGI